MAGISRQLKCHPKRGDILVINNDYTNRKERREKMNSYLSGFGVLFISIVLAYFIFQSYGG